MRSWEVRAEWRPEERACRYRLSDDVLAVAKKLPSRSMTCRVDVSRLRNILFDTSSFMFFAFPRALDTPSCDSICPALLTMSPSGRRESLLFLNFNQDQGCFACGTDAGFRIYNCDPFKETFRRRFDATNAGGAGGGIGIVEMLFRCNILALVGGGRAPRYSPNKVMLWDDHQSRCIGELSFRVEVRAVKLRRDKIVVVLEHKIYVYNFSDLKIVHQTDTVANPKGLCALSPTQGHTVMACPGLNKGQVRVELYDVGATKFISAHDGDLAMLALSLDGARLATASEKGTLVRVYDTASATLLREFRRGADRATIYSIAFSATNEFLACSSDKGTVHVWEVSDDANETTSPEESDARADSSGVTEKKTHRRRSAPRRSRRIFDFRGVERDGDDAVGDDADGCRAVRAFLRRGVFAREPRLGGRALSGAVQAAGLHAVARGVRAGAAHARRGHRGGHVLQGGVRLEGRGRAVHAAGVRAVHEERDAGGGRGLGRRGGSRPNNRGRFVSTVV